jgi:Ca2+-transporting ATPase
MWHTRTREETLAELTSTPAGLTEDRVKTLSEEFGPNELKEQGKRSAARLLFEQFTATMVLILLAAGILALILGDPLEAIAIFAIVILFGIMGFLQEYRAEKALAALKKLSVPFVQVRRAGSVRPVPAVELVPGDIVLLETGNIVAADCRILESHGLRIQESALTGESEAVEKHTGPIADSGAALGDRRNMAYLGTQVVYGRGEAVVTATGMATELGKIATLIQNVEAGRSPLQQRLENLGRILALAGLAISALVALLGVLAGESLPQMLILGISMAVAIIPEGLPAVLTITLALGAGRMLARHALIRKLPAVETLGSVTIICSDKTGTLTQNRMTVTKVHSPGGEKLVDLVGSLCNDSKQGTAGESGRLELLGDPTETCLFVHAQGQGIDPFRLQEALPRTGEVPFDATRKRMSTRHGLSVASDLPASVLEALARLAGGAPALMAVKGSADGLLSISDRVMGSAGPVPLDAAARESVESVMAEWAGQGMRVLAFAAKPLASADGPLGEADESGLVFIGLAGIIDPPRPEVRDAIATCRAAGIRPVMITGDHPLTAAAIARDLGMDSHGRVITGRELEAMEDSELRVAVNECSVFARVSPEHKLRIVDAFQFHRQVVAMTGDGVNDAPALRKADIGVAMGITGTDVSKEASQMVLTDDNFASIVAAVEEGRVIFDNIRKYIKFSLGGNIGKVVVLLLLPLVTGVLASMGLAGNPAAGMITVGLTAIQLLWLNLLCDGLLSIGLGVEHGEPGVMRRQPVKPKSSLFNADFNAYVLTNGLVMGLISLGLGLAWWRGGADVRTVQTVIFMALFFLQMWAVFSVRTGTKSVFHSGMPANRLVLLMVAVSLSLQMAGMYLPGLQDFLSVKPLPLIDLGIIFLVCLSMVPILEVQKAIQRRTGR